MVPLTLVEKVVAADRELVGAQEEIAGALDRARRVGHAARHVEQATRLDDEPRLAARSAGQLDQAAVLDGDGGVRRGVLSAKESKKPPARVTMLAPPAPADSEKVIEPALLIVALPADPFSPMNKRPLLSMVAGAGRRSRPRMLVMPVLVIVTPVRSPLATSRDPKNPTETAPVIYPALPPPCRSCSVPAATVVPPL